MLTAARLRYSSGWSWSRIDDALRTAGLDLANTKASREPVSQAFVHSSLVEWYALC